MFDVLSDVLLDCLMYLDVFGCIGGGLMLVVYPARCTGQYIRETEHWWEHTSGWRGILVIPVIPVIPSSFNAWLVVMLCLLPFYPHKTSHQRHIVSSCPMKNPMKSPNIFFLLCNYHCM